MEQAKQTQTKKLIGEATDAEFRALWKEVGQLGEDMHKLQHIVDTIGKNVDRILALIERNTANIDYVEKLVKVK